MHILWPVVLQGTPTNDIPRPNEYKFILYILLRDPYEIYLCVYIDVRYICVDMPKLKKERTPLRVGLHHFYLV